MSEHTLIKRKDRDVLNALEEIRKTLAAVSTDLQWTLTLTSPFTGDQKYANLAAIEADASAKRILDLNDCLIDGFQLKVSSGHNLLSYSRKDHVDALSILNHNSISNFGHNNRPMIFSTLAYAARQAFNISASEAILSKAPDAQDWQKFYAAQEASLAHLQSTAQKVISSSAEEALKRDSERIAKYEAMETQLRDDLAKERKQLEERIANQERSLKEREGVLSGKEKNFETKEARYVARQKQDNQLTILQGWVEQWHLTQGTEEKRNGVKYAYWIAMGFSFILTSVNALFVYYAISHNPKSFTDLAWWQHLVAVGKIVIPFAAFSTFVVYYIRWQDAWARLHAEEELFIRRCLIDIGRSGWLIEAVRDAQERKAEIPDLLLKQLSNDMFSSPKKANEHEHNHFLGAVLDGLSSVRVKSPDGSEFEAKKGKGV